MGFCEFCEIFCVRKKSNRLCGISGICSCRSIGGKKFNRLSEILVDYTTDTGGRKSNGVLRNFVNLFFGGLNGKKSVIFRDSVKVFWGGIQLGGSEGSWRKANFGNLFLGDGREKFNGFLRNFSRFF